MPQVIPIKNDEGFEMR